MYESAEEILGLRILKIESDRQRKNIIMSSMLFSIMTWAVQKLGSRTSVRILSSAMCNVHQQMEAWRYDIELLELCFYAIFIIHSNTFYCYGGTGKLLFHFCIIMVLCNFYVTLLIISDSYQLFIWLWSFSGICNVFMLKENIHLLSCQSLFRVKCGKSHSILTNGMA